MSSTPEHAIASVAIVPVAFHDPPLLNAVGVHEPFALRAIVEIVTRSGVSGVGETYGDLAHLTRLEAVAPHLIGLDPFETNLMRAHTTAALRGDAKVGGHGMGGMVADSSTSDRVLSPFDVASLDIQGKILGRPVADLLGGAVRDRVPFSAYLFYKWAAHPGGTEDSWGAALDPDGLVAQARRMVDEYGFSALKLKAGVFPPEEEIEAIHALRRAFPGLPTRIDPNAAWTVETAVDVGLRLEGELEYLEDPTPGIQGMADVRARVPMPLATNMCVVNFDHLPQAAKAHAVDVILSDHHFWGGLRRSQGLAAIAETFGWGLSMHSNSHLGVSLAAMVHLAAATPNLDYACDTHWPWKRVEDDVVAGGSLNVVDGAIAVPDTPGLGVEIDRDALARLHELYLSTEIRTRDDSGYMRRIDPAFTVASPRW